MEETCSLYLLSNSFYGSLSLLVIPPGRKKIVQYAMRSNMNWKLVVISCERLIVQSNKREQCVNGIKDNGKRPNVADELIDTEPWI